MKWAILAAVVIFLLWLFCILKIPQFPNNACMSLSLGGVLGGGGSGGVPSPQNATQPDSQYSVTLSSDDQDVCTNTMNRMYITTNIPSGECGLFLRPLNDTNGWRNTLDINLGANGAWSDTRQMPSAAGTYYYDAVCRDREHDYGVSPYLTMRVADCTGNTPTSDRIPCLYTPPDAGFCNCPAGYIWDTGFRMCQRTTV